ncbi:MAG: hypothetical protein AABY22_08705 [Nanoarchaeota archaeon]
MKSDNKMRRILVRQGEIRLLHRNEHPTKTNNKLLLYDIISKNKNISRQKLIKEIQKHKMLTVISTLDKYLKELISEGRIHQYKFGSYSVKNNNNIYKLKGVNK